MKRFDREIIIYEKICVHALPFHTVHGLVFAHLQRVIRVLYSRFQEVPRRGTKDPKGASI